LIPPNVFRLDFGLDMTSKVTVKENKFVHTKKLTHPRNNDPNKSRRPCVASLLQSIYIPLET
jgi:hypothetical protein